MRPVNCSPASPNFSSVKMLSDNDSFDDLVLPVGVATMKQYIAGAIVAYEQLDDTQVWEWSVAEILKIVNPRVVQVRYWEPKTQALSKADEDRSKRLLRDIDEKTKNAISKQEEAEAMAEQLGDEAYRIDRARAECEEAVRLAEPAFEAARKGLNAIQAEHLRELRSYSTPPPTVRKVLEAVLIVLGTGGANPTWDALKTAVRKDDFIPTIRDLDPGTITKAAREEVQTRFLADEEFTSANVMRASRAAGPLLSWLEGIINYIGVMERVRPKQQELERLSAELKEKEDRITATRSAVDGLQAEIAKLRKLYTETTCGAQAETKGPQAAVIVFADWVPSKRKPGNILHSQILCCLPPVAAIDDDELHLQKPAVTYLNSRKGMPNIEPPNPLEKKVKALQFEVDELEDAVMERDVSVSSLKQEVGKQKETISTQLAKNLELTEENDDLQAQLAALRAKLAALSEQATAGQQATMASTEKVQQLERTLQQATGERDRLLSQVESLAEKLGAVPPPVEPPEMGDKEVQTDEVVFKPPTPPPPSPPPPPEPAAPEAIEEVEEKPVEEEPDEEEEEEERDPPVDEDNLFASTVRSMAAAEQGDEVVETTATLHNLMHPQYLMAAFEVTKTVASAVFSSGKKLKRTWVIDQMTGHFHNLDDKGGKISKSYSAAHLIMLEKCLSDPCKLTLLFYGREQSHELSFASPFARERFYELAQAMRPTITIFCPAMVEASGHEEQVDTVRVTFTATGANALKVDGVGAKGEKVSRTLKGECKFSVSNNNMERLTVTTVTCNLSSNPPPKDPAVLEAFLPRNQYDLYAVAAHGLRSAAEWGKYLVAYFGQGYQVVATINFGSTAMTIFVRSRLLGKISQAQGSKYAVGACGGAGISFFFYETPLCFVVVRLPSGRGCDDKREQMLKEIFSKIDLEKRSDFMGDHVHTFLLGEFNYCMPEDIGERLSQLISIEAFDELAAEDEFHAHHNKLLSAFREEPVTYGPTAFTEDGPAYTAKVLYYMNSTLSGTLVADCYTSVENTGLSEHNPVVLTATLGCPRLTPLCFLSTLPPAITLHFTTISVVLDDGVPVGNKAILRITCPHSTDSVVTSKPSAGNWSKEQLPAVRLLTPLPEVLLHTVMTFCVMNGAELVGWSHVALCSDPEMAAAGAFERKFTAPLILNGGLIGRVDGHLASSTADSKSLVSDIFFTAV